MRALVTALFLLASASVAAPGRAATDERISCSDEGVLTVKTAGKADATASLYLWYDNWVWRDPGGMKKVGEGRWAGVFAKRAEDGEGSIEVTQTVAPAGDAVRVTYDFRRKGAMELTNGIWVSLRFPYPDYAGRPVVFTHGPPGTTDSRFEVPARGCTVNISDAEALVVSSDRATRFVSWVDEGKSVAINMRLARSDLGETGSASMTVRFAPAVKQWRSWDAVPQAAPLQLSSVAADRQTVGLFEPVEFTLDLAATYDNPFDPDQVAVDAAFRTPSGRAESLAGFYCQGFRAEYENGEELLALDGAPAWKVRYTPREAGQYEVAFRARDRSGEVSAGPVRFRCVRSGVGGFARIGEARGAAPRHFRLDNGRTLFLIGHNVVGYQASLEDVFRKMEAGGENYTRFWMCSWSLGLEWGMPVGQYRMQEAWRLDRLFDLAAAHGIYVMLCMDTHQDFIDGWRNNPYNAERGGPCKEVMDYFTNEGARAFYKKRLRYLTARYGCRTNLLCWEFANEIEGWAGAQDHKDQVADWHAEMGRFVRAHDPFRHPITSSQWTTEGWPELWNLPEMEFVQSHYYADNMYADMAGDVARICRQKLSEYPQKLHVFGEYGISSGGQTRKMDPTGVHLHNGNWAALMSGCASNPVSWWHDDYIDPLGLYRVYCGLANFVAGEDLAGRAWRLVEVSSVDYAAPLKDVAYNDLQFRGPRNAWAAAVPPETRFVLHRDGTVENLDQLPDLLHGKGHADLRAPFVFGVDCRKASVFSVQVGTVSAGGILDFQVDGQSVYTVSLPTGEGLGKESKWREEWKIWETRYDREYSIEVPAGQHTIVLENRGDDWIQIQYFKLQGYVTNEQPPLRVLGMAADDRALLWAQNRAHTWFNVRDGKPMPAVEPTRVCLTGLADGRWHVELWDTVAGKVTGRSQATARGGELELALPRIETDLALKLSR